jgi:hypothetical protein
MRRTTDNPPSRDCENAAWATYDTGRVQGAEAERVLLNWSINDRRGNRVKALEVVAASYVSNPSENSLKVVLYFISKLYGEFLDTEGALGVLIHHIINSSWVFIQSDIQFVVSLNDLNDACGEVVNGYQAES